MKQFEYNINENHSCQEGHSLSSSRTGIVRLAANRRLGQINIRKDYPAIRFLGSSIIITTATAIFVCIPRKRLGGLIPRRRLLASSASSFTRNPAHKQRLVRRECRFNEILQLFFLRDFHHVIKMIRWINGRDSCRCCC